jgi:hypothetical protein
MTTSRLRLTYKSESQSETYITIDGQSACLSWNKAPAWGLRPDFYYCQTIAGLLMWGALSLSLTRVRVCRLHCSWTRQRSHFRVPSPVGLMAIIYCFRFEISLFVASYDSQGYGGGIRARLHTRSWLTYESVTCPFITPCEPKTEHTPMNSSTVILCICVATGICLPSRCLALDDCGFQASCHSILLIITVERTSYLTLGMFYKLLILKCVDLELFVWLARFVGSLYSWSS